MTEEIRDASWYVKNRGLATGGVDILKLTNEDIPLEEIEAVFGPKISKNGYRYDRKPEGHVVASILQLYQRVTGRKKVINNHINQQFARGVTAWLKGGVLDWANYAVHCNKYAADLRQTKSLNREMKVQGCGPQQLLMHRKVAPRPPTTKKVNLGALEVKFEGKVPPMPSFLIPTAKVVGGPQWKDREIAEVRELVKTLKNVFVRAKETISAVQKQHSLDAAAFEVCKMHLEGRQTVHLDSESQKMECLRELEDLLNRSKTEGGVGVYESAQDPHMNSQLDALPNLQRKLQWAENNQKVAESMLSSCQEECLQSKANLDASLQTVNKKKQVLCDLGAQIACVEEQLKRMTEGDGLSFYPQPIICNPEYFNPAWNSIEIIECPVCGHGFQFLDILVSSCGHTYHPACLNWHAQKSLLCRLASCQKPFHADWLLSVGVRAVSNSPDVEAHFQRRKKWMNETSPQVPDEQHQESWTCEDSSVVDSVSMATGLKQPSCESSAPSQSNHQQFPVPLVKPKESLKFDLKSAFNVDCVPQFDDADVVKKGVQVKEKPLQMGIFGQKETLWESDPESDSSDYLHPKLVHYPPRPIIHRDTKQPLSISLDSDSEASDSEPDIVRSSQDPPCEPTLAARTVATVLGKESDPAAQSPLTQVGSLADGVPKRKKNPCEPNPSCEKRKTRAANPSEVVHSPPKKKLKKKKKQEKVKSFNYWA